MKRYTFETDFYGTHVLRLDEDSHSVRLKETDAEYCLASDVDAALAAKDAELERCKRAVEWLKRHTSHLVYAHDNQMLNCIDGKLYAFGDSIADIIKPAAGGDGNG